MKHLIISFRSRDDLYGFAKVLKANGVFFSIINTPKSIASSCTLSIKSDFRFLKNIQSLLIRIQPRSFLGLYSISISTNGEQTLRLF